MFDMTHSNSLFYMYGGHAKHAWRLDINVEIAMWFKTLATVVKGDSGATSIEYGLIAALVSVAAIGALTAMGGSLNTMFQSVSNALTTAAGG